MRPTQRVARRSGARRAAGAADPSARPVRGPRKRLRPTYHRREAHTPDVTKEDAVNAERGDNELDAGDRRQGQKRRPPRVHSGAAGRTRGEVRIGALCPPAPKIRGAPPGESQAISPARQERRRNQATTSAKASLDIRSWSAPEACSSSVLAFPVVTMEPVNESSTIDTAIGPRQPRDRPFFRVTSIPGHVRDAHEPCLVRLPLDHRRWARADMRRVRELLASMMSAWLRRTPAPLAHHRRLRRDKGLLGSGAVWIWCSC